MVVVVVVVVVLVDCGSSSGSGSGGGSGSTVNFIYSAIINFAHPLREISCGMYVREMCDLEFGGFWIRCPANIIVAKNKFRTHNA